MEAVCSSGLSRAAACCGRSSQFFKFNLLKCLLGSMFTVFFYISTAKPKAFRPVCTEGWRPQEALKDESKCLLWPMFTVHGAQLLKTWGWLKLKARPEKTFLMIIATIFTNIIVIITNIFTTIIVIIPTIFTNIIINIATSFIIFAPTVLSSEGKLLLWIWGVHFS